MKTYYWIMAVLIATVLAGCTHSHSQGETSEEHAHDESLRLTAYSSDFEVFAEATPFVVGQASDILAHFSHLSNFKPLTEGSITVSLIVGTDGVRQTVEKPSRDGIYLFSIKPVTMGTGKLVFDIRTAGGTSQVIVTNVKIYDNEHDAQHAAVDAVESSSNGVIFTKEQSWKVDFATAQVERKPFGQVIRTAAQIQPSQIDEKVIVAKASGIVSFSGGDVVVGKAVASGQSLFSIESGGLADNNIDVRYNEAVSEYNRAKADYERKKGLAEDRIVSQRDLQEAETAFKNAEAVYNNLRQNFSSGRQVISSSLNGFVKQVFVRNGEYAEAGQPVVVVSRNSDLLITANVQPKYGAMLADITGANFRVMNTGSVYSLDELNGKVLSHGRSADLSNPLIPVSFSVRNMADLTPGTFVEMFITTRTNSNALTVPVEAIVEEMGAFFVFVQITPEYFEKRVVATGVTDGFNTEILKGVSDGERVVSKGAILVKLSQASGSLDAEHGHAH